MNATAPNPTAGSNRASVIIEALLTIIIIAFLVWLAVPLGGDGLIYGLDSRYLEGFETPKADKAARAIWLAQNLGSIVCTLGIAGWCALRIGRSQLPRLAVFGWLAAIWLIAWGMLAKGHGTIWFIEAAMAAIFAVVIAKLNRKPLPIAALPNHAAAYPGWVLFTGLGLIWLVDLSARSYPKLRFLAVSHADSLFFAYVILTTIASFSSTLAGILARVFAALDNVAPSATTAQPATGASGLLRKLKPITIPLVYALWAAIVVIFADHKRPALPSELLRLPFYLIGGWTLYRWALHGQAVRAGSLAALGVLAVLAGLAGMGDFGQVLLIGLGLALATGGAVALTLGGGRTAILAGVLAAVAIIAGGLTLINNYGHLVSSHIGHRANALNTAFSGKLEYLSELRWFAASTPSFGHGLTHTPYCGTAGSLTINAKCSGVPVEMQSDYVFAGLAGIWGIWAAFAVTASLAFWLVSLVRVRALTRAGDPNDLRHWVFTCFAVVTLVQLLFTCLGSVGLVALTGITYPLLAFGSASLIACAAMLGLAMQR